MKEYDFFVWGSQNILLPLLHIRASRPPSQPPVSRPMRRGSDECVHGGVESLRGWSLRVLSIHSGSNQPGSQLHCVWHLRNVNIESVVLHASRRPGSTVVHAPSWHAGSSSSSGGDILIQLITGRSTLAAATACVN